MLCLLALLPPAQEDARLQDLVRKLEDDAFDVREQAQSDLVKLGEPALPALRKILEESKDRAELRLRVAAALREIETLAKSRLVCPDAKLATLKAEAQPLGRVLEELARQYGVTIDASPLDLTAPVTLDLQDAPLMRALDGLCRDRDDRRWEFVDDERIRFLKEPQAAWPTSYTGAFRVRLNSLRLSRSTNFREKTAVVRLVLEADCERRVKPAKGVEILVTQAVDDKGGTPEIVKGDDEDEAAGNVRGLRVNRAWVRVGGMGAEPATSGETFTLKNLDSGVSKISLQGTATFRFPLDRSEIRFAPPQSGETRDAADLKLRLDLMGNARWKLSISRAKPDAAGGSLTEDVQQRLDLDSLTGLDEEGQEHKGSFQPSGDTMAARIVVVNGVVQQSVDGMSYLLQLPTLRGKTAKEIRFKFADRVLEKKIPFSFQDVPLP